MGNHIGYEFKWRLNQAFAWFGKSDSNRWITLTLHQAHDIQPIQSAWSMHTLETFAFFINGFVWYFNWVVLDCVELGCFELLEYSHRLLLIRSFDSTCSIKKCIYECTQAKRKLEIVLQQARMKFLVSSLRFRNSRWRLPKEALHFDAFLKSFYNYQYHHRYYLLSPSSSSSSSCPP